MVSTIEKHKGLEFDEALNETGFGRYNIGILSICCLLILAMYLDIFGFSIILPAAACDLQLTTEQQAMLSAVPLIGFGRYNIGILSICCLLILAMYLDIFGFSIILPAAACDLQLTTEQQAMLSAVPLIGFGRYNIGILSICCLLILAMYLDIFGFSIILPAAACDLQLTTEQQAMLSAVPLIAWQERAHCQPLRPFISANLRINLISTVNSFPYDVFLHRTTTDLGVMCMSYVWGLTADTLGRRATLLYAMGAGFLVNLAASLASGYVSLCLLKLLSASFTASANAAGYVMLGEMTPKRHRNRFMFLMASTTMFSQCCIAVFALAILPHTFRYTIAVLGIEYRPWRLLMQVLSLPGGVGTFMLYFYSESPKFLLNQKKDAKALMALRIMFKNNTGSTLENYSVQSIYLEDNISNHHENVPILQKIWNQSSPLFKPPLLKYSLIIYYILLTAYMTSTGYTMWVPTLTNMYFDGGDYQGKTFCEVASGAAAAKSPINTTTTADCDNVVQHMTLYAVMLYSGLSGCLNIALSFIVGFVGRKKTTLGVFFACALCGAVLNTMRVPVLSIVIFYLFLYVCLVLAGINSYIVELYPTYLRGTATSLSVVVARGSGFLSVNVIAMLLAKHCELTMYGFVALVMSGGLVSFLLPPDMKKEVQEENIP